MNSNSKWSSHIAPTYAPPTISLTEGFGSWVVDVNGKKYLDFISGIAVSSLGHSHPVVGEAIMKQWKKLAHVSNLYSTEITAELAFKLLEISGFKHGKVFFCNSGAEANEAAIKYVRANKNRSNFVSLNDSFHGRTMGALSITGQSEKRKPFLPLLPKVKFVDPNNLQALEKSVTKRTGGLWLEIIQGEAGVIPLTTEFIRKASEISATKNALLIVDEVQTGFGRTGKWFAFHGHEIEPDLVPIAKSLGAGLPMGALLVKEQYGDLIGPGGHGSTFGGNPTVAAGALAMIEVIEKENLIANARFREEQIRHHLNNIAEIKLIRGSGLLIGVVLHRDIAKEVEVQCRENGLLINSPRPNVLRLAPPLNVSESEIRESMDILVSSIKEVGNVC